MTKLLTFEEVNTLDTDSLQVAMTKMMKGELKYSRVTTAFIHFRAEELGTLDQIQEHAQKIGLPLLSPIARAS